ncbi:hypothetical protein D9M71_601950 [compost metagenome]
MKIAAASMAIRPMVTKVSWNAPRVLSTPSALPAAVKPPSRAPAQATPRLSDNCATTDSRLLPLLALLSSRSIRVTVFIAVNCIELTAPSRPNCNSNRA